MNSRFWDEPTSDDKSLYDPVYVHNRDSEVRQDIRDFVEQLWSRYEPYCGDAQFLPEVRRHFSQFTWQMYVGVCLLEAGHTLEKAAPDGPDHKTLMMGRRVWVECIAPGVGEGNNVTERTIQSWTKTEAGGYGMYRPPADDKIAARLTGALYNKVQQHRRWVAKGIVSADDPTASLCQTLSPMQKKEGYRRSHRRKGTAIVTRAALLASVLCRGRGLLCATVARHLPEPVVRRAPPSDEDAPGHQMEPPRLPSSLGFP